MNTLTHNQAEQSPFDSIRRIKENGAEFWMARELMPLLGYQKWERFEGAIDKAKVACQNVGNPVPKHFSESTTETKGRPRQDFSLSRYACYLVAMAGDSRKKKTALAQSYFASKLIFADYLIWKETGCVTDIFGYQSFESTNDDSKGFIYLVRQSATPYYKIGKSKNPYKRMQSLQTGTPLELIIVERYFSIDCTTLERLLHQYYDAYWVRGEWFDLSSEIVSEFLSVARMLDDKVELDLLAPAINP